MMQGTKVIDGRAIADELYEPLAAAVRSCGHDVRLGVVVNESDAAAASYVRLKQRIAERLGVLVVKVELQASASTEDATAAVASLVTAGVDGIVVQLPLPVSVDVATVLSSVPPKLDVDALNPTAEPVVRAPVAGTVQEILRRTDINVSGKRAVVVGAGRLVGAPVANLLRELGANVSVVTSEEGSLDALREADVVVSGAGKPGLITPNLLKPGVVLLDAGTSESAGRVVGDADPSCAEYCSVFTPVPGGIGPVAVAMLFRNLLVLARC